MKWNGLVLPFVETNAVGEKLHCWSVSIACVRPAEFDTNIVCAVNCVIPKQHLVGEIARRIRKVRKKGCGIVIVLQGRDMENPVAGMQGDRNGEILAVFCYYRGSKKEEDQR